MKKIFLLPIIGVCLALSLATVSAWGSFYPSYKNYNFGNAVVISLVEKDPVTWEVIPGASGTLMVVRQWNYNNFGFSGRGLDRFKDYTLIYYGDATHNDVWPYATCLGSANSGYFGRVMINGRFPNMLNDGIDQKIWLVPSSDVDCSAGELTAWNPTEYLFEYNTI